jgi:SWI/SNF-related matrix-associated actin-dependent regulator 1 of chromatin subfamily A
LFHYLAPDEFRSFFGFAKRYCGADNNGYGFDPTGASNLPELQDKLRGTIMIRRLKADVLTELPAKRRSIIEIPANGASAAVEAEADAFAAHEERLASLRVAVELAKASDLVEDYRRAVGALMEAAQVAFSDISRLRHETAVAKIPYVVEHIRNIVDAGSKLVVFAHHHDVIEAIAKEFGSQAVTLYGATAMDARQAAVDRFQNDPECLVFVGGILAAGVGITLTAASHVVFAELDWVPGNVTQAEDRCHRIGQRDCVLVQHLVLEGSLDARMAGVLVEKQEVQSAALDKMPDPQEASPVVPSTDRAATESASRAQIEAQAAQMTAEQIAAAHRGLQMLAAMDGDRATSVNGMGFSKLDVEIGHRLAACATLTPKQAALAAKLVVKYRRQVPECAALLARATASAL